MADANRELELKLKASGGDAAAKEIQKPEQALEQARKAARDMRSALDGVESEGPQFDAAMETMEQSVVELEEKIDRASESLTNLNSTSPKAGKSSRNMGLAVLEASRAFEDLQYGIRGVLNNIPQMLMMLGVGGGVTGVVSIAAVALTAIVPKLLATGDAAKETAEKFKEAEENAAQASEDATERINRATQDRIQTMAGEAARAAEIRLEEIHAEGVALDGLTRKAQAYRRALLAMEDAKAAETLAQIDADEASGKIDPLEAASRRVDLQNERAAAKAAAKLEELEERVTTFNLRLQESIDSMVVLDQAAQQTAVEAAGATATQAAVDENVTRLEETTKQIESLKAELAGLHSDAAAAVPSPRHAASEEQLAEVARLGEVIAATKAALKEQETIQRNLQSALPDETARGNITAEAEARKQAADAAAKALADQQALVREKRRELELEREIAEIEKTTVTSNLVSGQTVRNTRFNTQLDRSARDEAQAGIDTRAKTIAQDIDRQIRNGQANGGDPEILQALQSIRDALADGTDRQEMVSLATQLTALSTTNSQRVRETAAELANLRSIIENQQQ